MGDCLSSLIGGQGSQNQQTAPPQSQAPPSMPPPPPVQQQPQGFSWMKCYNGEFPRFGVVDSELARALMDGNLKVGTYHVQGRCCYIPHNGTSNVVKNDYESPNSYHWAPASNGTAVPYSMPGGKTEDGRILMIGRVDKGGQKIIGSIGTEKCYYPDGDKESNSTTYDVLLAWSPELAAAAMNEMKSPGAGGVKASDFNPGKWTWVKYYFDIRGVDTKPKHPVKVDGAGYIVARTKIGSTWVLGYYDMRHFRSWHNGSEVREVFEDRFECMDSNQVHWQASGNGVPVPNAVPCGDRDGETVYIGRVSLGHRYGRKCGFYEDSTSEKSSDTYEILVYDS